MVRARENNRSLAAVSPLAELQQVSNHPAIVIARE